MNLTKGAVVLRYSPWRRHRNDRLNIQHLILEKKLIVEKKIVDGDLDGRIQANVRKKTSDFSVLEVCSSTEASIQSLIQEVRAVVFVNDELDFRNLSELKTLVKSGLSGFHFRWRDHFWSSLETNSLLQV